jgi:hypothetical protein
MRFHIQLTFDFAFFLEHDGRGFQSNYMQMLDNQPNDRVSIKRVSDIHSTWFIELNKAFGSWNGLNPLFQLKDFRMGSQGPSFPTGTIDITCHTKI